MPTHMYGMDAQTQSITHHLIWWHLEIFSMNSHLLLIKISKKPGRHVVTKRMQLEAISDVECNDSSGQSSLLAKHKNSQNASTKRKLMHQTKGIWWQTIVIKSHEALDELNGSLGHEVNPQNNTQRIHLRTVCNAQRTNHSVARITESFPAMARLLHAQEIKSLSFKPPITQPIAYIITDVDSVKLWLKTKHMRCFSIFLTFTMSPIKENLKSSSRWRCSLCKISCDQFKWKTQIKMSVWSRFQEEVNFTPTRSYRQHILKSSEGHG